MVMSQHYPLSDTDSRRLFVYLNEGNDANGDPVLQEVSVKAGIVPPTTRAPHIQLEDLDNDGMLDIMVSSCKTFVYWNKGVKGGIPHFDKPVGSDYEGGIGYWSTGPLCDYDRDGRLDFFGAEWEPAVPSPLLRNVTPGAKNYLAIKLDLENSSNRNGIGARVDIYKPGKLGAKNALIGTRIITNSNGYSCGYEAIAHFGLPDYREVDVSVHMPCDGPVFTATSVKRNQLYIIKR
jgi:hypothetical protein